MTPDQYLQSILAREAVNTGPTSPVLGVQALLQPTIAKWAGRQLRALHPSGSFSKGTANHSGTDIDLFVSLLSSTTNSLKEIYESLFTALSNARLSPSRQNVSINIKGGGYSVDLVPAKHQGNNNEDHSLYRRRADTWTKTNVVTHINAVRGSGRTAEIRILKLWRDQKKLDFPSFYLELATIIGLTRATGTLSQNVLAMFVYLRDTFPGARIVDPANTNNVISEDLTVAARTAIKTAAANALAASNWGQIVV